MTVVYIRSRTPASQREDEMELTTPYVSAKCNSHSLSKSNSDGLLSTKSGRMSMICNEVNAKYDASYRNSDNINKLLGRSLSLGRACGINGVALYANVSADIPLEDSGIYLPAAFQSYIAYSTYYAFVAYFDLH
jgi:hypothetical protein